MTNEPLRATPAPAPAPAEGAAKDRAKWMLFDEENSKIVDYACRINEHFDATGTIKGDGKWRLNEISKLCRLMREAERELVVKLNALDESAQHAAQPVSPAAPAEQGDGEEELEIERIDREWRGEVNKLREQLAAAEKENRRLKYLIAKSLLAGNYEDREESLKQAIGHIGTRREMAHHSRIRSRRVRTSHPQGSEGSELMQIRLGEAVRLYCVTHKISQRDLARTWKCSPW
jgi:hypothetical protein